MTTTTTASPERRVQCERSPGRKTLLRIGRAGLLVWCKFCKAEHCIGWDELERLRRDLGGDALAAQQQHGQGETDVLPS